MQYALIKNDLLSPCKYTHAHTHTQRIYTRLFISLLFAVTKKDSFSYFILKIFILLRCNLDLVNLSLRNPKKFKNDAPVNNISFRSVRCGGRDGPLCSSQDRRGVRWARCGAGGAFNQRSIHKRFLEGNLWKFLNLFNLVPKKKRICLICAWENQRNSRTTYLSTISA